MQLDVPQRDTVDLIVEFRDAPLFVRSRIASATDTAAAMKAFDTRFAQFASDIRTLSPRITNTYERVFAGASVTVPRSAVAQIEHLSYVKRVYVDAAVHALDDASVAKVGADQVWTTYGTRGRGVVVAVIDTGIDYTHPALGGAIGPNARVIGGFDFVNKDTDPMDDNGHGTHVAGIIGANSDKLNGIAPEVSFLAYKVLSASGSGRDSDVIAAIDRASDPDRNGNSSDHADVVNMSLGNNGTEDDPVVTAVENAAGTGIVFCIAAGNSGNYYSVGAPAVAPSAIAVGASDFKDAIAFFSSAGPAGNSLALKPEVVAPGVGITSTLPGGTTGALSGTSMAAPQVAGIAALVKSVHRDWSPADIKSAIVTTAEDIGADVMAEGAGRVDALHACGANVVASPAVLSFGRDDASRNHWTATSTIDLTNRSDAEMKLTATATTTGSPNGITITVDPQTFTLQPGETQTATVTVAIDNSQIPYPDHGSLTLSGRIAFDGGSVPIHVPWAFVKAARIRATYDLDDSGTLIVTGTAGSKTLVDRSLAFGARQVDAYVAPGTYDMQLYTIAVDSGGLLFRFIFGDRKTITADTTVPFSSSMAASPATLSSKDDQGRLLASIGTGAGACSDMVYLVFPQESALGFAGLGISSKTGGRLRFAAATPPEGFSLTANEECWDGKSSLYVAQYGSISSADAVYGEIAVDPSTWQRAPLRVVVPDGLTNPSIRFGPSSIMQTPVGLFAGTNYIPMSLTGNAWTGMLYITPERHPVLKAGADLRLTADLPSAPGATMIDARILRATDGGILLSPYATNSPTTYLAKSGETLTFGGGPIHPEGVAFIDGNTFNAGGSWAGPLDEARAVDALSAKTVLRDESGAIVATDAPFQIPKPGIYQAEITNGPATFRARIDSRLADNAAPVLRALRIVDADGRETPVVFRGAHATLRFAALDLAYQSDTHTFTYALPSAKTATASWRVHGSAVWQQLALRVEASDVANTADDVITLGHVPVGLVFASDLTAVAQTDASIDMRLHVEDDSGNAIDYELDNAFTVAEGRQRAVTK